MSEIAIMKFSRAIIAVLTITFTGINGLAQQDPLSIFDPLVGYTWSAEGKWGNGSPFKQEILIETDLDKKIVISRSRGYTNQAQTVYGDRNFGIRQFDSISGKLKFWEFDVFGGLTVGEVIKKNKNILYQYDYGSSSITDMWEYVNDSTYNFIVGSFKNGQWEQQYLSTQFTRSRVNPVAYYGKKLVGNWTAEAWDGVLEEDWVLTDEHKLSQQAVYSENGVASYKAQSRIALVDNRLIIYSVIEGSNPKIFKATSTTSSSITFENSDYGYPNKLLYKFKPDGNYSRTISGVENGVEKSYTFEFKRMD